MGSKSRQLQRKPVASAGDDESSGGSCCTWPRIILMVIVLAIAGILIWKFAPVDDAIDSILPSYNTTGSASGGGPTGGGGGTGGGSDVATEAPTPGPTYQFMQCDSGSECCNGLTSNCDLAVNELLYASVHNAMATFDDGFIFGPNHEHQLEGAVEAGYRGLNLDLCNCGGQLVYCHGICSLGPRDVVEVMDFVNTFLDDNPTELLVIVHEVNSNVDQPVDLNAYYELLASVDGLTVKLYIHPGPNVTTWPTLRELTDPTVNKRVIMFHYNGPNCDEYPEECPEGLHWYYNYASDNNWEHTVVSEIATTDTSCILLQNEGGNKIQWMGINDFVVPPRKDASQTLNSYDFATSYVNACSAMYNKNINFILADFWSEGELPRVAQDQNKARASQRRRDRSLLRSQP